MGNPIRLAGQPGKKLMKAIPFAGDIYATGLELFNKEEPNPIQRALNAVIVGGGGAAASFASAGLDAVPAFIELSEHLMKGANTRYDTPLGPKNLQQLQGCSPALNVEHYLRSASYLGQKSEYNDVIKSALSECHGVIKDAGNRPRFGGLVMPVR